LDFSKRPVLLQTHPGALAVKLKLTTGLERRRAYERSDKPRGLRPLAPVPRPNAFPLHNVR
jgi:hypothetical protein